MSDMIKRFKEVSGLYIEKIYGQDRLAFAMSDTSDLYDLVEYAQRGGYQGSVIKCYYPEKISFSLEGSETVVLLTNDRVYIEKWIEEGWDEENDCATDEYKYYDKVLIKDYAGNLLSEEIGSLYQAADGTYWMA